MEDGIRIDKWLWAVRIFKTRSMATNACKAGKVKIDEQVVKPSREVKLEDEISVRIGAFTKKVKVIGLISRRVSAKIAIENVEDITEVEELEKLKMIRELNYERRDRGMGRPTKKERRDLDNLKSQS